VPGRSAHHDATPRRCAEPVGCRGHFDAMQLRNRGLHRNGSRVLDKPDRHQCVR
jgi:hypothetical protein